MWDANNCYNTGNVMIKALGTNTNSKYIAGICAEGRVKDCYNLGNIEINTEKLSDSSYIGGIGATASVTNSSNIGNIKYIATNKANYTYIGGISGSGSASNSYNGGNIDYNTDTTGDSSNISKITCGSSDGSNHYLKNAQINIVSNDSNYHIIENTNDVEEETIAYPTIDSEEYYNKLNTNEVWTHIDGYAPKLLINSADPIESVEMNVLNKINKFNIITEVENIDGIKGGTISGEGELSYEAVRYGESNQKEITMIPDNGYAIAKITINGKNIQFEEDEEGTYKIPANYFTNVQEDKKVVVSYTKKLLTINKIDENSGKTLEGAKFDIENIISYKELKTNANSGFVLSDGKYITNSTMPTSSYVEVDLTNKEGEYNVLVNAQKSSSSLLAVNISDNTNELTDGSPYNKFIYLSAPTEAVTYSSPVLQGGKKYYLQLKCFGGGGITINSIDVVETEEVEKFMNTESEIFGQVNKNDNDSYYFEYTDGKLIPTNNNNESDIAKSYIEVDLSNKTGKYAIEMKAETNSGNMVAKIAENQNETQSVNEFYSNQNFMWINAGSIGYGVTKDYSYVSKLLEGGKKYYILISSASRMPDKVTSINSVRLLKYTEQESFKATGLVTDSNGQIRVKVPYLGKYTITETEAPKGYILNATPTTVEVTNDGNNVVTIKNGSKRKVTVHHYLKESDGTYTNIKVAEDEIAQYAQGEKYETKPRFDLENLTLEKINGKYVITDEASGIIEDNDIEVNYYYETSETELTIHHYLKGSQTKLAEDEKITYLPKVNIVDNNVQTVDIQQIYKLYENSNYNNLKNEYNLDSIVIDESIINDNEISFNENTELFYYYTDAIGTLKVQYLEHETEKELLPEKITSEKIGKLYNVSAESILGYTQISTVGNTTGKYENGEIVVKFYYKQNAQVKVNYIQRNTINTEGTETQEPTIEETLLESKTSAGLVGEVFKASSKNFDNLLLVEKPENETVRMQPEEIELNYYYSPVQVEPEKGKVVEKHINIVTNSVIENKEHEFNVGEQYKIEPKEFDGFDLVETKLPTNAEDTATNGIIEVNYYYIRKIDVVAKYIDEATNQSIFDDILISGHEGELYTTLKQEKEGYQCIVPENANGTMAPNITLGEDGNEIINSTIYVVYKYKENMPEPETEQPNVPEKEKIFNLKIDKVISKIILDGKEQIIANGKFAKTEVHRKQLNESEIIVEYTIKVSNIGEQEGTATLSETIPEGFTMNSEDNYGWVIENNTAKLETGLLKQGEEKEYKVVLHWNKGDNNIGIKVNTATLINETNEKGTKDANLDDNTSSATLIITISTGDLINTIDPTLGVTIMIVFTLAIYVAIKINE